MPDMMEQFYQQQMHGTYFRVLEEGDLQAGDAIELIETSPFEITILDVTWCFVSRGADQNKLIQILNTSYLPESLKNVFRSFAS